MQMTATIWYQYRTYDLLNNTQIFYDATITFRRQRNPEINHSLKYHADSWAQAHTCIHHLSLILLTSL
jgi:hypothetical protein